MLAAEPIIDIAGVRKSFGRATALGGLSMQVAEGKVSALLGPNGAGKTTLVRILATLLAPDAGRVTVAGIDVARHPVAVRRVIGLAGQHAAVDQTLTGRENLVMVGRLYRLPAAQARQRSAEVLERLSLTGAADRPVRTYSGGMRRRLDVGASLVGQSVVITQRNLTRTRRTPQAAVAAVTSPVFFLFLFVSNAFIPVATLPRWLQGFAASQPVSVFNSALRALTQGPGTAPALGHDTTYLVTAAIAWCAGIAVVFAAITLRLYKRT